MNILEVESMFLNIFSSKMADKILLLFQKIKKSMRNRKEINEWISQSCTSIVLFFLVQDKNDLIF